MIAELKRQKTFDIINVRHPHTNTSVGIVYMHMHMMHHGADQDHNQLSDSGLEPIS